MMSGMISKRHIPSVIAVVFLFLFLPFFGFADAPSDFAVIGNTRIGLTENIFKVFLSKVAEERIKTLFVVGDVIDTAGSEEQWRHFLDLTGQQMTFHIAPGDHDFNNYKSLRVYRKILNKPPYYSFALDDTQFIILCPVMPDDFYAINGKQLEWLEEELEKPFRHRIAFIHMPLFPTPQGRGFSLDRHGEARDRLHDLFVEYKVDLVFQGHEPLYNRTEKDGVTYVITGGGGARLLATKGKDGGFFHYVLAKKLEEGYVFTVYNLLKGSKEDEFFLK
jgi:serine/threonine-protein phosphatase CPPED1